MKQPLGSLGHTEGRRGVEHGRFVGIHLGIELELEVEKGFEAAIARQTQVFEHLANSGKGIGHRLQGIWAQGLHQTGQIPRAARR